MYFIFQIILLKHKLQTTQNIMAKHNGYSPFQVLHGKAGGPHKAGALHNSPTFIYFSSSYKQAKTLRLQSTCWTLCSCMSCNKSFYVNHI